MIRFNVDQIENAFLLSQYDDATGDTTVRSFPNEKKLVNGVRELLGLKPVGRPKPAKTTAFNPFAEADMADAEGRN